jgi:hypothetical protein
MRNRESYENVTKPKPAGPVPIKIRNLTEFELKLPKPDSKKYVYSNPRPYFHRPIPGQGLDSYGINDVQARTIANKLPRSLEVLDLRGNGITDKGITEIADNLPPQLRELYLRNNKISCEGATALAKRLPRSLEVLDLAGNYIEDRGAIALSENMPPNLKKLMIECNGIEHQGYVSILGKLPEDLEHISLFGIGNVKFETAKVLGKSLPNSLQSLGIGKSAHINTAEARIIAENIPSSLKSFQIDGLRTSKEGMKYLIDGTPSTLERLIAPNHYCSDGNVGILEALSQNPKSLEVLDLSKNGHTEEQVNDIPLPSTLSKLDISDNWISKDGMRQFAERMLDLQQPIDLKVGEQTSQRDDGIYETKRYKSLEKIAKSSSEEEKKSIFSLNFLEPLERIKKRLSKEQPTQTKDSEPTSKSSPELHPGWERIWPPRHSSYTSTSKSRSDGREI